MALNIEGIALKLSSPFKQSRQQKFANDSCLGLGYLVPLLVPAQSAKIVPAYL